MSRGRPKGSTSALAARASARNLGGRTSGVQNSDRIAGRREAARLAREEAQAIREQARAQHELGVLCLRSEAVDEVDRFARLVRAEIDRAPAYLDPGLASEVRVAAEAAIGTAMRKLRSALAEQIEKGNGGR